MISLKNSPHRLIPLSTHTEGAQSDQSQLEVVQKQVSTSFETVYGICELKIRSYFWTTPYDR